jgi:nucleoside-diphosphate-sugar epimerase
LLAGDRPALTLGEQRWDYLYVDDAVEALVGAALASDSTGVFNLGSGNAVAVRQIVEYVRDLIDPSLSLGFGELPYGAQQIMHLQADISRLHRATGWEPRVTLEQGLRTTVEWSRAQLASQTRSGPLVPATNGS